MTIDELRREQALRKSKPLAYKKIKNYDKQLAEGKSIAMMQLQPSYLCNFQCSHCSISVFRKQKKQVLSILEVADLCRQADEYGLAQIDLTGGEPLVYPNLFEIIQAIRPERFYLTVATNGWFLDMVMALLLKEAGVDRILLSLDSLNEEEHDRFRNKPGSHQRAIQAIFSAKDAGLDLKIDSVITHQRVHSQELKDFLDFIKDMDARLEVQPPKLAGEWQAKTDVLLTDDDYKFLEETYGIEFHTSAHYGRHFGCCAVKKIITVTAWGDVMPCIWMYYSLGNIRKTPLKDLIEKGLKIFGAYHPTCRMSQDKDFMEEYQKNIAGKELPIEIPI